MIVDILLWLGVVELIGIISIPIVLRIFGNLNDKGFCILKTFAFLLVAYFTWIISIIIGYNTLSIFIAVLIIIIISAVIVIKSDVTKDFSFKNLAVNEIVFITSFLIFTLIRAYTPEICDGEKFYDLNYITSLLRTQSFPPYDAWLSGESQTYYYFAYFLISILIKISTVAPSVAYNLGVPLVYALTVSAAYGIGYNLTKKARYGLLAVFLIAIAGNGVGVLQPMCVLQNYTILETTDSNYKNVTLIKDLHTVFGDVGLIKEVCYVFEKIDFSVPFHYSSEFVIPKGRTEFPYNTFLNGNLHASFTAIPFQLLMILLLISIWLIERRISFYNISITALTLGFLSPLNGLDYAVYLILLTLVIFIRRIDEGFMIALKESAVIIPIISLSIILYLPYYLYQRPPITGIEISMAGTQIQYYLLLLGVFIFPTFLFLCTIAADSKLRKYFLIAILIIGVLSFLVNIQVLAAVFPLILLSVYSLQDKDKERRFLMLLVLVAGMISLFTELVIINMGFSKEFEGLPTFVKLYMHIWIFLAIFSTYSIYHLNRFFSGKWIFKVWIFIMTVLMLIASIYPIGGTYDRTKHTSEPTLDGSAFLKKWSSEEYDALNWINNNIDGNPVILEANGSELSCIYSKSRHYSSRVSVFTGLPTVIGWPEHAYHTHLIKPNISEEIQQRIEDVTLIYTSNDINESLKLIEKYNIKYIYIGITERRVYQKINLTFPKTHFELVFDNGGVQIYKLLR